MTPQSDSQPTPTSGRLPRLLLTTALGALALSSTAGDAFAQGRHRGTSLSATPKGPSQIQTVDLQTLTLNAAVAFETDRPFGLVPVDAESPFREPETMLLERTELGFFMASGNTLSVGGSSLILDDPIGGEDSLPASVSSNSMGRNVRDAVRADIDNDGRDEMIVLTRNVEQLEVYRVDVSPQGESQWQLLKVLGSVVTFQSVEGTLAVGDFDGDKRDEIAVFRVIGPINAMGNTSHMWVIDDPVDGANILWDQAFPEQDSYGSHNAHSGITADLDGDGDDELIIRRQGETGTKGRVRFSMLDWSSDLDELTRVVDRQLVFHNSLPTLGTWMTSKVAAGQFDSDPADEVAVFSSWPNSSTDMYLTLDQFNYNTAAQRFDHVKRATFSGSHEATPYAESAIDVCAFDRYGDGRDWIGLISKPFGGFASIRGLRIDPDNGQWISDLLEDSIPLSDDAVCLEAGDTDSDRSDELYAGFSWGTSTTKASWVQLIDPDTTPSSRRLPIIGSITSASTSNTRPLVLAPGEYDGDGLRVRYQQSTLRVSNPVPLTLLAAVPTKAGISQNYDNSSTGYSVGMGAGVETAYSTSTTISAAAGFEAEDFTGTFGGSVKATMDYESSSTNTQSTTTTIVTGYESSHDADVIVFASNNLLVHEYKIMDAIDPNAVGRTFSIDVPLETQISKWEVPFYNAHVLPEYQITADLLPHTIGDPASYRGFNEMSSVIEDVVSWATPTTINVGQGTGGSVSIAIELASEVSDTSQTEMALGASASFKAFGVTTEASIAFGEGSAYTVSTNTETVYEGQIGDIGSSDWSDWAYGTGLAVYQAWRLADDNNLPTGSWLPGGYPLTVIDFWTDPFGARY